jgi:hypothetical protein
VDVASGFAFGYAPTGRSVFYKIDRSTQKLTTGGIHYSMFDVGRSMFDLPAMPWKRFGVNLTN